jgi:hypothetical protein
MAQEDRDPGVRKAQARARGMEMLRQEARSGQERMGREAAEKAAALPASVREEKAAQAGAAVARQMERAEEKGVSV